MIKKRSKIYVAMSGGIDSSVSAALLREQGNDVVGVFFKPWSPEGQSNVYCNWKEDRLDAIRVAAKIGIKFKTWDFSKEYKKSVVEYMIKTYKNGATPNPDVLCNKEIKFGLFLKRAIEDGADYIATGHYVRKKNIKTADGKREILLKGVDPEKDQSYFLWMLNNEEISRSVFPIGEYHKYEVRSIAKNMGLHNSEKKDSQGVCFVGELEMKAFLSGYIKPKEGKIIDFNTGEHLGKHGGAFFYTIGQRHGFSVNNGKGPYYVSKIDVKKNMLYVSNNKKDLLCSRFEVNNINWTVEDCRLYKNISVKTRYQSMAVSCAIKTIERSSQKAQVVPNRPMEAVTSGQSAVFYSGEKMLGGGIII